MSDELYCGERPLVAMDGSESIHGRGLFAVSSLYWCTDWLAGVDFRLVDVSDENVELAAEVARAELGVSIQIVGPRKLRSPLAGVSLYAAVAFRSAQHLRLAEAAGSGIPTLLSMQFPSPEYLGSSLLRQGAAFDPRIFAQELGRIVKPWL